MVKYEDPVLDRVFSALADPTRRGVLDSLAGGGQGVSELAVPHQMSLPGFMKHLRVLEDAGLVGRSKEGRVVSCELSAKPMKAAAAREHGEAEFRGKMKGVAVDFEGRDDGNFPF